MSIDSSALEALSALLDAKFNPVTAKLNDLERNQKKEEEEQDEINKMVLEKLQHWIMLVLLQVNTWKPMI